MPDFTITIHITDECEESFVASFEDVLSEYYGDRWSILKVLKRSQGPDGQIIDAPVDPTSSRFALHPATHSQLSRLWQAAAGPQTEEPTSEKKVKRFMVFGHDQHYPSGGWGDYLASFGTRDEALAYADSLSEGEDRCDYDVIGTFTHPGVDALLAHSPRLWQSALARAEGDARDLEKISRRTRAQMEREQSSFKL